jgi:hypothetical protein
MSLDTRKIIFFIAGTVATAGELALIARLRGNVVIRSVLQDVTYNTRLEAADGLAGAIPDSYKTDTGTTIDLALYPEGDVTPSVVAKPEAFKLFPATLAISAGTFPLRAVSAEFDDETGAIALADLTAETEVTYESSVVGKATVSAGGVVTKVAAGETTITATYEYATGETVISTCVVTVS